MSARQPGLTLLLGGVRAGKTRLAERLAAGYGPRVRYVATAEAGDDELQARIAAHRAVRPPSWKTLEAPLDPVAALISAAPVDAVLFDCLTLWTSNLLLAALGPDGIDAIDRAAAARATAAVLGAVRGLLDWQATAHTPLIVVSNEVGLGVTPPYPLGRLYADALGAANQLVAARAERVYLVVAGLALDLGAAGAVAVDALGRPPVE